MICYREPDMDNKPFDAAFSFKDDLNVREIFADGLHLITVEGTIAKITLTVSRPDDPKPGQKGPPRGYKVPVARLALTTPALAHLFNQVSQIMHILEAQGLVKREGQIVRPTIQ
jgi:hypothetical protein